MTLAVDTVTVDLGGARILDGVSLEVADGETLAVLGPSGSGKTTLLRAVAGLVAPRSGRVLLDGVDLAGVPAHRRRFGVVFQSYALFDHLDVAGNVGFGPRMAGRGDRARLVDDALALVGLAGFGGREVASLSGGERQRVALARALVVDPVVLLLDEPLGAVDVALKGRLLEELAGMVGDRTTVYVTHDHDEAMTIGDRVAVLRDGRLVALGTPERLWSTPPDGWVARFLGHPNVFDDGGPFGPGPLLVPERSIRVASDGREATVVSARFAGDDWRVTATIDGHEVVFRAPRRLEAGMPVRLGWSPPVRLGVDQVAVTGPATSSASPGTGAAPPAPRGSS